MSKAASKKQVLQPDIEYATKKDFVAVLDKVLQLSDRLEDMLEILKTVVSKTIGGRIEEVEEVEKNPPPTKPVKSPRKPRSGAV